MKPTLYGEVADRVLSLIESGTFRADWKSASTRSRKPTPCSRASASSRREHPGASLAIAQEAFHAGMASLMAEEWLLR